MWLETAKTGNRWRDNDKFKYNSNLSITIKVHCGEVCVKIKQAERARSLKKQFQSTYYVIPMSYNIQAYGNLA